MKKTATEGRGSPLHRLEPIGMGHVMPLPADRCPLAFHDGPATLRWDGRVIAQCRP